MSVATFEATVENGQVRLPQGLHLPDQTKVYLVVPGMEPPRTARIASPRLVHREQAKDFRLEVRDCAENE